MEQFKNILVGVDLAVGDRLVCDELTDSTLDAIERGLKVAKQTGAHLSFFYSLDISAQAQRSIQEDENAEATVLDKSQVVLRQLVQQAKQQQVEADSIVTFGKSWIELIRFMLRKPCDLVLVGSKQHAALERLFIGSTGMNLLRNCPCPVWVTHPERPDSQGAVLVAHDLTDVGEHVLELGIAVAKFRQSPLHVVHVLEPQHVNIADLLTVWMPDEELSRQAATVRISEQLEQLGAPKSSELRILEGSPDEELRKQIDTHNIDLLVMGTLARSGIKGLLIGNTAERLLPQVPCSVLAVKPAGFQTPITVE